MDHNFEPKQLQEILMKITVGSPAGDALARLGKADAQQTAEEAFARMGFVPASETGKTYCIYETPYGSLHIALLQGKVFSIGGMETVMEKLKKDIEEAAAAAPTQDFYFCENCGQKISASFKFCNKCGYAMTPLENVAAPSGRSDPTVAAQVYSQPYSQPYPQPYAPTSYAVQNSAPPVTSKRLSGGAKAWLIICLVLNAIIGFFFVAISSETGESTAEIVLPGLLSFAVVAGYSILLAKKKAGLYVVCICAFISMIINFVALNIPQAFFSIINPVITWLLVRQLWDKD